MPHHHLGERELKILSLVAEGYTDAEIGAQMNLSPKTINYHVEKVKAQFGVRTRIEAVVFALRRGYIY